MNPQKERPRQHSIKHSRKPNLPRAPPEPSNFDHKPTSSGARPDFFQSNSEGEFQNGVFVMPTLQSSSKTSSQHKTINENKARRAKSKNDKHNMGPADPEIFGEFVGGRFLLEGSSSAASNQICDPYEQFRNEQKQKKMETDDQSNVSENFNSSNNLQQAQKAQQAHSPPRSGKSKKKVSTRQSVQYVNIKQPPVQKTSNQRTRSKSQSTMTTTDGGATNNKNISHHHHHHHNNNNNTSNNSNATNNNNNGNNNPAKNTPSTNAKDALRGSTDVFRYAGGAHTNAPDPSTLPVPDFTSPLRTSSSSLTSSDSHILLSSTSLPILPGIHHVQSYPHLDNGYPHPYPNLHPQPPIYHLHSSGMPPQQSAANHVNSLSTASYSVPISSFEPPASAPAIYGTSISVAELMQNQHISGNSSASSTAEPVHYLSSLSSPLIPPAHFSHSVNTPTLIETVPAQIAGHGIPQFRPLAAMSSSPDLMAYNGNHGHLHVHHNHNPHIYMLPSVNSDVPLPNPSSGNAQQMSTDLKAILKIDVC